jgi:alanine dehydrogenase
MLLIDNDIVKRVLTMRECIEAQERAFAGALTGASVSRPRIDMFVPCSREDGYYRCGSVEGANDGVLAVRLKSDIMTWPVVYRRAKEQGLGRTLPTEWFLQDIKN